MVQDNNFKKYFFWVVVILLAILSYYIIKDFLIALLSSFVLAYLLLPLQRLFSKAINKKLSAIIILLLLIVVIIIPLFFISKTLVNQVSTVVSNKETMAEISNSVEFYLDKLNTDSKILLVLQEKIPVLVEKAGELLLNLLPYLISSIPSLLFLVIIIFFVSYFLLVEWDSLTKTIESILPFKDKKKIMNKIAGNSKNIVYGSLLVAVITFIVAAIGFKLAGFSLFIFLAFLTALAVFIPLIGPAIIWVPMLVIALIQADYTSAIITAITGIILSSVINGLLFATIVSKKSRIHQIIILLGVFGGVKLFGLFGFVIGPLILSFFIDFVVHAAREK